MTAHHHVVIKVVPEVLAVGRAGAAVTAPTTAVARSPGRQLATRKGERVDSIVAEDQVPQPVEGRRDRLVERPAAGALFTGGRSHRCRCCNTVATFTQLRNSNGIPFLGWRYRIARHGRRGIGTVQGTASVGHYALIVAKWHSHNVNAGAPYAYTFGCLKSPRRAIERGQEQESREKGRDKQCPRAPPLARGRKANHRMRRQRNCGLLFVYQQFDKVCVACSRTRQHILECSLTLSAFGVGSQILGANQDHQGQREVRVENKTLSLTG